MTKFIYVGGKDAPERINFMGKALFTLGGDPVEVDDERMIEKLKNIPAFKEYTAKVAPKPKSPKPVAKKAK